MQLYCMSCTCAIYCVLGLSSVSLEGLLEIRISIFETEKEEDWVGFKKKNISKRKKVMEGELQMNI